MSAPDPELRAPCDTAELGALRAGPAPSLPDMS
jgi:hypothetical protein